MEVGAWPEQIVVTADARIGAKYGRGIEERYDPLFAARALRHPRQRRHRFVEAPRVRRRSQPRLSTIQR
jgi:hypothetical protein